MYDCAVCARRHGRQQRAATGRDRHRRLLDVQPHFTRISDGQHDVRRLGGWQELVLRRLGWSAGLQAGRPMAAVWRRELRYYEVVRVAVPIHLRQRRQLAAVDRAKNWTSVPAYLPYHIMSYIYALR